jgi:hypothetical protein
MVRGHGWDGIGRVMPSDHEAGHAKLFVVLI